MADGLDLPGGKWLVLIGTTIFAIICSGDALRCFVCDTASDQSYAMAEKSCNSESVKDCQDSKQKACMVEAFMKEQTYHVVKKCLVECPVFVNSTAQHIRCCSRDGCNDFLAMDELGNNIEVSVGLESGISPGGGGGSIDDNYQYESHFTTTQQQSPETKRGKMGRGGEPESRPNTFTTRSSQKGQSNNGEGGRHNQHRNDGSHSRKGYRSDAQRYNGFKTGSFLLSATTVVFCYFRVF